MNIDFRLKRKSQVTSGLVMELIPGLLKDKIARHESIYIDEDAFGFVEPCIVECWPNYSNFGHWGKSEIPSDVWGNIMKLLDALRLNLISAKYVDDVRGVGFIFKEIETKFHTDFEAIRAAIASMIVELISWLDEKCRTCGFITILGI